MSSDIEREIRTCDSAIDWSGDPSADLLLMKGWFSGHGDSPWVKKSGELHSWSAVEANGTRAVDILEAGIEWFDQSWT